MKHKKPILSFKGQIEHLKTKGVRFEIVEEEEAIKYLFSHNNYFKLTAYRKNYVKHPDGDKKDQYIDLDFAYLVDMAVIDMQLRYRLVHMALDIEHHVKLLMLRKVEETDEDGYQIVQDYIDSLEENQKEAFEAEINRNKGNIYCGDIIAKYDGEYPIWAFVEIISFGRLVSFFKFCAERFDDPKMKNDYYRLLTCKEIRNASAHSNCILNDLKAGTSTHKTNADVTKALASIPKMSPIFRKNRMSNARIQQIVTLLYMHKTIVTSEGLKNAEKAEVNALIERMYKNIEYYKNNLMIKNTFDFLKMVVDSWVEND